MACAVGTFSGKKVQLAQPQVLITGQLCTSDGHLPDTSKISKVAKWPTPTDITQVCSFLGVCGTMQMGVKDCSTIVHLLIGTIKKDDIEAWDVACQESFKHMKKILAEPPVLVPMIADPDCWVTLAVDTSHLAIGFIIYQDREDRRHWPVQYGSLPLSERESQYSQAKLELYGLFCSLQAVHFWIAGFCNLVVEMDAISPKGMLEVLDLQPNAAMNQWIAGIKNFNFEFVHISAERHKGLDTLSRHLFTKEEIEVLQAEDIDEDKSFDMVPLQTASTDGHEAQDLCKSHDTTLTHLF
jgi:hypothetical protein